MSSPAVSASPATDQRLRGYAEIGGASLILGTSGALLQKSTMPASLLLGWRMGLVGAVLAVLFFMTGGIAEVRRSGHARRLVLMGFVVALELVFYFFSIRLANVAIGIALEYMAPVYIALAAPFFLHTRRRGLDMTAVAVAVAGMALIVLPSLTLGGSGSLLPGIVCGPIIAAGAAVVVFGASGEEPALEPLA